LLLAFTTSRSATALPLPARVTQLTSLHQFGWSSIDSASAVVSDTPIRLSIDTWQQVRKAATSDVRLNRDLPTESIIPPIARLASRLHAAALALGANAVDARLIAITHVLAPALATAGADLPRDWPELAAQHFETAKTVLSPSTTP
jgi:hypothetical protein